jgi:nitrate/nitrite-specific signal transduction histidine kinase
MEDKKYDELMQAVATGFNRMEDNMDSSFERLENKVDGLQNQLDNEAVRNTDKLADMETRVVDLEQTVFE